MQRGWKKQDNLKFDELITKVDIECFGCSNLRLDFKFMENVVEIAMGVWWNNRRKKMNKKKYS